MTAIRPLIVGNWKMNGTVAEAAALAQAVAAGASGLAADLVLCPPSLHLLAVAPGIAGTPIGLGGQDCHAGAKGAHTGDVSAPMLRDAGAGFVILGHSERRADHGETGPDVAAKALAAMAAGLRPIICVGEDLPFRESGTAEMIVANMLAGSLPGDPTVYGGRAAFAEAGGIVAYEPVWAIGTGRTPTEAEILSMHTHLRRELLASCGPAGASVPLLYGGSVKPSNAGAILALPDVNGALVGGASLAAADFLAIAAAA